MSANLTSLDDDLRHLKTGLEIECLNYFLILRYLKIFDFSYLLNRIFLIEVILVLNILLNR